MISPHDNGLFVRFLAGQMHVFRPHTDLARVLLALAPLLGAVLIAISRCEDYRHDVYDVTVGSLLGMTIAFLSYRRYYPQLRAPHCDEPYLLRDDTTHGRGYGKIKDEESRIGSTGAIPEVNTVVNAETLPLRDGRRSSEDD